MTARPEQRFAEDCSYWKTGDKVTPECWFGKAIAKIVRVGGDVHSDGVFRQHGRTVFAIAFRLEGEEFSIAWPLLDTMRMAQSNASEKHKADDVRAAKRQAATALYHHVNAMCVHSEFFGARLAFLQYRVLPSGQTVGGASDDMLLDQLPDLSKMLPEKIMAGRSV